MPGPLSGVTVVDLSTVIAGPYATQILGEMGARVIKVESPQGDIMRAAGPARSERMGAAFMNCNRNKQSEVLDLKVPGDKAKLLELVAGADVFIHNMRLAAATRLGLDDASLRTGNAGLIYCAIVGYGQDGPYRDRPAYDDVIQAAAGWAALEQRLGGEPRYAPTIVADKTTALYAVSAINAALFHRAQSGTGRSVEIPMFEILCSFLSVEHLAGRSFVPPLGPSGYSRLMSPNRRPYRTKDGYLAVMPYTAQHWQKFFSAAGNEIWASDPRILSDTARSALIDELYAALAQSLLTRGTAEWIDILPKLDIPCSTVNSIDDLLEDEHMKATGFFQPMQHPTEGEILAPRPPVRFSLTPCEEPSPAPNLPRQA